MIHGQRVLVNVPGNAIPGGQLQIMVPGTLTPPSPMAAPWLHNHPFDSPSAAARTHATLHSCMPAHGSRNFANRPLDRLAQ